MSVQPLAKNAAAIGDPKAKVAILLVDDRRDKLVALETVLNDLDQRLVMVTSGEDALRALLKEDFAVIILDVNMPGMDGFETASLIRQRKQCEHTPIIFVTGINITETHVSQGYTLGAVDYIFAPVDPVVLRAKVAVFIDLFNKTQQVKEQAEALRLAAEERADSIQTKLEGMLNRLEVGVFRANREGQCFDCNPAFLRIIGTATDVENHQNAQRERLIKQLLQTSGNADGTKQLVGLDGRKLWVSVSTTVTKVNGHEMVEGIVEDVTESKEAEEALRQNEVQYRTLIDALPQLVWTSKADGTWDYVSNQWRLYAGVGPDDDITAFWELLLLPEDQKRTLEKWRECVAKGEIFDVEHRLRSRNGDYRWHKTRALPIHAKSGTVQRWFGTCTDIDDQKKAEANLEISGRLKDEFLAMLSHELRNPLNAISGAIQLASRKASPDVQAWSMDVVQRQVKHLVRLIDDLLDVSRITRGKIELRRETVRLDAVLDNAVANSNALIKSRGHDLRIVQPKAPLYVHVDPARLEQIFINLLTNAAKYTPNGGVITVTVEAKKGVPKVTITDNGMGMTGEVLAKIFDLFSQADRSLDRSEGGLGIGLTVARRLAEMHGGRLLAHSDGLDKGSTFELELNGCKAKESHKQQSVNGDSHYSLPKGLKVLLVDDHLDTLHGTAGLLEALGCSVKTCSSGGEVLDSAEAFRPDVVLLDIGLPGINGYEVAQQLRQRSHFGETILVAVSGYGQEKDREASRKSGFNVHLVKPLDLGLLFQSVAPLVISSLRSDQTTSVQAQDEQ